ncbi:LPXTG cell wall anchor domain-containing protein [Actinophytocola sp. NPDC049390]
MTAVTAVTEMVIAGVVVLALGLGLLLFTRRRRRDQ